LRRELSAQACYTRQADARKWTTLNLPVLARDPRGVQKRCRMALT
jgi:hypothetical protein